MDYPSVQPNLFESGHLKSVAVSGTSTPEMYSAKNNPISSPLEFDGEASSLF